MDGEKIKHMEILLVELIADIKSLRADMNEVKQWMREFSARCASQMKEQADRLDVVKSWQDHCNGVKDGKAAIQYAFYIWGVIVTAIIAYITLFKGS